MKLHNVTQNTPEWLHVRSGIPTASAFDRIVTPSGKKSTQADAYLNTLLAERLMGRPIRPIVVDATHWMRRGKSIEADAVSYYELQCDARTEQIGFVTNDSCTIGASPDRFVGSDGMLEIKSLKEHTHVGCLMAAVSGDAIRDLLWEYYPQIQGQLWVCEREWSDFLSYHPEMPPALVRVNRDDIFIVTLRREVEAFVHRLDERTQLLAARGWIGRPWPSLLEHALGESVQ